MSLTFSSKKFYHKCMLPICNIYYNKNNLKLIFRYNIKPFSIIKQAFTSVTLLVNNQNPLYRDNVVVKNMFVFGSTNNYCTGSYEIKSLINNHKVQKYINELTLLKKESNNNNSTNLCVNLPQSVSTLLEEKINLEDNIKSLDELMSHGQEDPKGNDDFKKLAEEEKTDIVNKIKEIDFEIIQSLVPNSPLDNCKGIVLEVSAGVGGQEAMLFAKDLYAMYCGYIQFRGWTVELADYDGSEIGGLRHASILVYGKEVYKYLRNEGGVHRVQRIPTTEKSGRIHTSTVTVAVLPQPDEVEIILNDKDLKIETKRASGPGGQSVNTTDSAVRITHLPSGLAVECQNERSQIKNKQIAMQKLRARLYEKKINDQISEITTNRKHQVGTSGRSEKIRTYNFNQDRITDHRLNMNAHNLSVFLQGGEPLNKLIEQLLKVQEKHKIEDFVETISS
uniref:Prokaryotic-type class I peptide chain release factors domain-containing protein n=1 Tax=Clastoptera arizonana TaxID=38151 RepID=A0A1B6C7R2_9HEMI